MNTSEITKSYYNFAYYYNQLIDQGFYHDYYDYLKSLGEFHDILDLACGSGSLCFLLKNETNQVSGIDLSSEMLMIAQDNNHKLKKGVNFIQQDLKELNLYQESYDLITCTLDSINYIETEYLADLFKKVSNALEKHGYFCFDVLSQFYIDEIVDDYYQSEEFEDFEYVWQVNKIDDHIIRHQLEILSDTGSYKEVHWQFIHDLDYLKKLISENGLIIKEIREEYNELNSEKPARYYFTIQKES